MTTLLQKAIRKVEKLPKRQQDEIATLIIDEISDEIKWDEAFSRSGHVLEKLSEEAIQEYKEGKTRLLDLD